MVHAKVVDQPHSSKQAGSSDFEYERTKATEGDDINTYGNKGYGKNTSGQDCSKLNYSTNANYDAM